MTSTARRSAPATPDTVASTVIEDDDDDPQNESSSSNDDSDPDVGRISLDTRNDKITDPTKSFMTQDEIESKEGPGSSEMNDDASDKSHCSHRHHHHHSHVKFDPKTDLSPPMSINEKVRDWVLGTLDRPIFQVLGVLVLLAVIVDGAIFFFFLMGWQTLCDTPSKTNCSPRNEIYNVSIQILTGLFTYMVTVSMPWRCANTFHVFGLHWPKRKNDVGYDIYGVPSHDVWYHIPLFHRKCILFFLLMNCITQYLNQGSRIVYNTFDRQNVSPGNIWTNVFFGASMICAFVGGVWMGIVSERIRKQDPDRFGPGPIQVAQRVYRERIKTTLFCMKYCPYCARPKSEERQEEEASGDEQGAGDLEAGRADPKEPRPFVSSLGSGSMSPTSDEQRISLPSVSTLSGTTCTSYEYSRDPTREPRERTVLGGSRAELRMFGM